MRVDTEAANERHQANTHDDKEICVETMIPIERVV